MQRLEISGAVRPIYGSLGVKRLIKEIRRDLWRCQLCIKIQPEDGFKLTETCSCYVLLIIYIFYIINLC